MKKNTVLKKEFKPNDVQRLRNIVQGKYGDRTTTGIGYTKIQDFHGEGDIWEEDSRKWTIKNGIKQNITKLDLAKKGIILPMFCPKCSRSMKPHLDKRWFIMYGHCFDCQVDFEAQLKKEGKLQEFENKVVNDNIDGFSKDLEIWFNELINEKQHFITEAGDIEKWDGNGKHQLIKYKKEALEYLQNKKR